MPITVPNNEKTLNKDINFFPQPLTLNIEKNPYSKSASSMMHITLVVFVFVHLESIEFC